MFRTITRTFILISSIVLLTNCKSLFVAQTTADNLDTSKLSMVDSSMQDLITPYRSELASSMNVEVAQLTTDMINEQPESAMGNHIAQIIHSTGETNTGRTVDFAVMNYRGLRIPSINKGPLIVSHAYQIMPFDNYIVVMELKGSVHTAVNGSNSRAWRLACS